MCVCVCVRVCGCVCGCVCVHVWPHPELFLQAQPVKGSSGVVEHVQMTLQGAHIQLCVPIQEVLQQSLVDERVLHLSDGKERGREKEREKKK